jgi:hypothetical protein
MQCQLGLISVRPLTSELSALFCLISFLTLHTIVQRGVRTLLAQAAASCSTGSALRNLVLYRCPLLCLVVRARDINSDFKQKRNPPSIATGFLHLQGPLNRQCQPCHRRPKPCTHSSLPSPQRPYTHTCSTTSRRRHQTSLTPLLPFSRPSPHLPSSTASGATKTTSIPRTGTAHVACHMTRIALRSSGSATLAVRNTRQSMVAAARRLRVKATLARQTVGATRACTR